MMKIGLIGSSQTEHVAKVLEKDYIVISGPPLTGNRIIRFVKYINFLRKIDILYRVYAPSIPRSLKIAHWMKIPIVLHWIGSDVLAALKAPDTAREVASLATVNITCFDGLRDELDDIGIHAEVVPIVPFNISLDFSQVPKHHSVMVYMPKGRERFYGIDAIKEIAKALPNLTFNVVANDDAGLFQENPNIKVQGMLSHEQMESLYDEVSIILRLTFHDGLSMSVIEALAKGKQVIWNHSFAESILAFTPQEVIKALNIITEKPPTLNRKGHQFIEEKLNYENVLSATRRALANKLAACSQ